jgi:hypothetical protein
LDRINEIEFVYKLLTNLIATIIGYATKSLPPTRSECDVGVPVSEPTITEVQAAKYVTPPLALAFLTRPDSRRVSYFTSNLYTFQETNIESIRNRDESF